MIRSNPAGTNDEAAALKDESGKPVSNAARNTWVTETALATALNMSYMATGVAIFSIVVGVALILAGVGFLLQRRFRERAGNEAGVATADARRGLCGRRRAAHQ